MTVTLTSTLPPKSSGGEKQIYLKGAVPSSSSVNKAESGDSGGDATTKSGEAVKMVDPFNYVVSWSL